MNSQGHNTFVDLIAKMTIYVVDSVVVADHKYDEPAAGGNPPHSDSLREGRLPDTSDGVLLQVGGLGGKLWPGALLLVLENSQ